MHPLRRLLLTLAVVLAGPVAHAQDAPDRDAASETPSDRVPQFVLVGLDATPGPDTEHAFSRRVGDAAERAGARVTYFINTQNFLLDPSRRRDRALDAESRTWLDPGRYTMRRISYASSVEEVRGRLATTRYLIDHGHEMASHGVHHERGRGWTLARWRQEFDTFGRFHAERLGLPPVLGFRAPYLAWNPDMNRAEADASMQYDASRVSEAAAWPTRTRPGGVWSIPVYSGRVGRCRALFFDDGLRGCHADDEAVYRALHAEFDARYGTSRAPLVLSSHQGFVETVYVRLLADVCHRPEVRCVTFATLAAYMEAHPELAGYGDRVGQMTVPHVATPAPSLRADTVAAPHANHDMAHRETPSDEAR